MDTPLKLPSIHPVIDKAESTTQTNENSKASKQTDTLEQQGVPPLNLSKDDEGTYISSDWPLSDPRGTKPKSHLPLLDMGVLGVNPNMEQFSGAYQSYTMYEMVSDTMW